MSQDERRRAEREAREDAELADAIERCWRSRFGKPAVVVLPTLARIRRGGE